MDLFARIPVSDLPRAIAWGDELFGPVESFAPNDTEHVWTLQPHLHVYVEVLPQHAGHGSITLFVDNLGAFMTAAQDRGLAPGAVEVYENGVRKAIYVDPDGNEVGVGGGPA